MKPDHSPEYLHELKSRLSKKYPQLTNADLFTKEDNENDMLRMVALNFGRQNKKCRK